MKLQELFQYRELLKNLVAKELKVRYKRSVLGFVWTFLHPLGMMLIYWFVFSKLFTKFGTDRYYLYLISGVFPWNFFAISLSQSTTAITSNVGLIKKIYFPRELFPISIVLANLVNFVFTFLLLIIFLLIIKVQLNISILLLPIIFIIQTIFTIGLTLIISCMNVFFGDIVHLLEVVLMGWFFLTPIFYPLKILEDQVILMKLMRYNPMFPIIEIYHKIIYEGVLPNFSSFIYAILFSLLILKIGLTVFKKYQADFAKVL